MATSIWSRYQGNYFLNYTIPTHRIPFIVNWIDLSVPRHSLGGSCNFGYSIFSSYYLQMIYELTIYVVQTILLVPVLPHGVLQLGSLEPV